MTSMTATYGPQGDQSFRCSADIPGWDTPTGGNLKFTVVVPDGYPQPTFSIVHDKVGSDKTWYTNISNGAVISVSSGNGGPGGHALYIATTSKLPDGLDSATKYAVVFFVETS